MKQCILATIMILSLSLFSVQRSYGAFALKKHESNITAKMSRRDLVKELKQITHLARLQRSSRILSSDGQHGEKRHGGPLAKWSLILPLAPILLFPIMALAVGASLSFGIVAASIVLLCPLAGFILGIIDMGRSGASFLAIAGTILSGLELLLMLGLIF